MINISSLWASFSPLLVSPVSEDQGQKDPSLAALLQSGKQELPW